MGLSIKVVNTIKNEYKCWFAHCKHDGKVKSEESVIENGKRYHADCLQDKHNREEIKTLFLSKVNPTEIPRQLLSVINNIVDKKNVPSNFLLFALKYVIAHNEKLNHAAGLNYIINNNKIKEEYKKKSSPKFEFDIDKIKTNEQVTFHVDSSPPSWGDIFRK